MVYLKRSILTFRFKGRPRRGLFWKKDVYRLWFDFAKLSNRPIPKEFGDLRQFNDFEDWWRHPDYGFELFCEPVREKSLYKVSSIDKTNKDIAYLKVNLDEDPKKLKVLFGTFLKRHKRQKVKEKKSQARFQPSVKWKHMRLDAWKDYLEIWKIRNPVKGKKLSCKDTYEKYYNRKWQKHDEVSLRQISRSCCRVEQIFKSIEKGTFP